MGLIKNNTQLNLSTEKLMTTDTIIYSINIEDIQTVAEEELDRKLAETELKIINDKIGDYIDWYNAISRCLNDQRIR